MANTQLLQISESFQHLFDNILRITLRKSLLFNKRAECSSLTKFHNKIHIGVSPKAIKMFDQIRARFRFHSICQFSHNRYLTTYYCHHLFPCKFYQLQIDGFYRHPSFICMVVTSVHPPEGTFPQEIWLIERVLTLFEIFSHWLSNNMIKLVVFLWT